jgi:hypothetical protein
VKQITEIPPVVELAGIANSSLLDKEKIPIPVEDMQWLTTNAMMIAGRRISTSCSVLVCVQPALELAFRYWNSAT